MPADTGHYHYILLDSEEEALKLGHEYGKGDVPLSDERIVFDGTSYTQMCREINYRLLTGFEEVGPATDGFSFEEHEGCLAWYFVPSTP